MINPPKGYWNISQAVRWAEVAKGDLSAMADRDRPYRFGGVNSGHDAAHVVREALECGELRAAGVRAADGVLTTLSPAAWRIMFARPDDPQRVIGFDKYFKRDKLGPPAKTRTPFAEARDGREVPVAGHWVMPIIAQADLTRWVGEDPCAEPLERPDDWPVPAARAATDDQLEWFASGYAVRAMEGGKPATRDELRDAVTRENVSSARKAEDAHKNLPARLKGIDKSKGSNRPK